MQYILGIGIGIVVVGIGFWFLHSSTQPQGTGSGATSTTPTFPTGGGVPKVTRQGTATATDPVVANDFTSQIQNPNQINLQGTVVVSGWALQTWGDENKGGEALLKQDASGNWNLVSLGGGEWSVEGLVQQGVPSNIAQELIKESPAE